MTTRTHREWSTVEDRFLTTSWGIQSAREIGAFLERSRNSVLGRAFRLGLGEPRLSPDEVRLLRRRRDEANREARA
jgi:hypothetical protein